MFLSPRNSRVSAVTPEELVPQGLNLPDNRDEQTRREHAATGAAPSLDSTPVSTSVGGGRARTHMFVRHQLGDVFIPHFCSIVCPPFVPLKCSNCVSQMWLPWRCARRRCRYKKQREEPDWKEDKEEQKKQRLEEREKPSPTHSAVGIYAEALHPALALRSLAM